MANMSSAMGLRLLADQVEALLDANPDPGPNPDLRKEIATVCARLRRFDRQAGRVGERLAQLAEQYYGDEGAGQPRGSANIIYVEMRQRLLTAVRARAHAFALNARF